MRYALIEKVFVVTWKVEKVPTREDLINWFGVFFFVYWPEFFSAESWRTWRL